MKEKARMIAKQQQQIIEREENQRLEGKVPTGEALRGGVRILPPSPVTVRTEASFQQVSIKE